jgi:hypothetical protein
MMDAAEELGCSRSGSRGIQIPGAKLIDDPDLRAQGKPASEFARILLRIPPKRVIAVCECR